ncbi:MAG: dihydrodipicolinate synthase family protein [Candidatus Latescibacteria bacterium]|jgi:4-hydroxy-tetrahydrodipicolinate synthase|nr:dihydrodipicolinate synthase family protein [Candidatus Latescibacterota bacterium]
MTTPEELRAKLQGPVVAMTTHFSDDGSIDLDAMRRLTEFYVQESVPTAIVTGSTGEFGALTDEERRAVQRAVIDTAQGSSMTVIAGVSDMASLRCIEHTKAAEQLGASGAMLTPPLAGTNGGGFPMLQHHYDVVTSAIEIGIVIYFSGAVMWQVHDIIAQPELMLDLVDSCNGNAAGFKDASGDFPFYRRHSELLKGKVATMGSAGMNYYLWGHEFGSPCFLTGLGNIWPKWEIEFYNHLVEGRRDEAVKIVNQKDLPYLAVTKETGRYWACVKALQEMVGLPGGKMRPPLAECTPAQREELRRVCTECGLME